jgi:hypothetical protein
VGLARARVSGRELLLAQARGRRFVVGERIAPVPIPAAWSNRIGLYEVVNNEGDAVWIEKLELRPRDGFLTIDVTLADPFAGTSTQALAPVSDDGAVTLGLGRGVGETIRAVTIAGSEHLLYSGYLLKKRRE